MKTLIATLVLLLAGCDPDPTHETPDAAPPAPDACPHTQEGCAGCGLENRRCCQQDDAPRFYCQGELVCDMSLQVCFAYNEPQPEPDPVTGTEIAIRLYGAMCEHERQCGRSPSDDCGFEMATRFCEDRRCGEEEAIDRAVLIACADEATTWQCEDQTNHHPPCVLEILALVAKAVPQ